MADVLMENMQQSLTYLSIPVGKFVCFLGDARTKAKLMFDMYDLDRSGTLTMEEFRLMLR